MTHFASNLRYLRRKAGKTQKEIGLAFGVSQGCITRRESGQSDPTMDELIRTGEYFGVGLDELLRLSLAANASAAIPPPHP